MVGLQNQQGGLRKNLPQEKLEVGVKRLSLELPKAEQNKEEAEQVGRVVQLIYQEESPDPSQWAGPSWAEARGAQQVPPVPSTENWQTY